MTQPKVLEGTWEEIKRHEKELAGRRLTVIVMPTGEKLPHGAESPLFRTASTDEWSRALREWAESHDRTAPPLSDEAISRDSIYEGRG
jgi:hypothetical protein